MAADKAPPWPTELRFQKDRAELFIRFDDGHEAAIPYELLRIESPSAETKGHGGDRPPPPVKKRKVSVLGAEPVGRYALRIRFDDGHDTGLYTWPYLRQLGDEKISRMAAYIGRLKELGLSRD
jgi:DUF971 family protein